MFALVLFAGLFLVGGGKATRTVDKVLSPDGRAAAIGLMPGDEVVAVNQVIVGPRDISREIILVEPASRVTLVVRRGRRSR